MIAFVLAVPELAPRYAPAKLRAYCPHCGLRQHVVVEGRHECAGRPYWILTPQTLRSLLETAKDTPQ